jgi:hypothetical protein
VLPVVMPHSEGWQASTTVRLQADTGASCTFSLLQGFNMSDLAQFSHYTNGGVTGPLNSAQIGALRIAPVAADGEAP